EITEEDDKRQEFFVIATNEDYNLVQKLWREIRETTETSAAGHIIKFYRHVVLQVAEGKDEFLVEDLTDRWNSKFENKKSSDVIGKWVRFLSDCGYLSRRTDPDNKRRKLVKVIKDVEKNRQSPLFELSEIFGLESFKAWIRMADKITSTNQVFLKESFIGDQKTTVGDVYKKCFLSETGCVDVVSSSGFQASQQKRSEEETDFQKSGQYRDFRSFKQLVRLTTRIIGKCAVCGSQGRMDWQVTMPDGSWDVLCDKCGLKLAELAEKD
ncbi:hypothetical protein KAU92_03270, partial [Candidatus Bathyarchaeota archaeon]|nr:hypothetical protein [Candidatus Bathyarchaeota archaeon]